jgi:GT2 family glycosyltransferase
LVKIMSAANGVSIVIPTLGRPQLVERLLASLGDARAVFDGSSEVVVVDSSGPREAALIRKACERFSARYLSGAAGVHQKRNAGARAASHDLLFFIDSDCEATADVLRVHAAMYSRGDARVAGVCGLTRLVGPPTRGWEAAETAGSFTAAFGFAQWLREVPWATCTNFSVRRDVFEQLGGFDETLPGRLYGEDVDLGLRLTARGYAIRSAADAVVLHNRVESFHYAAALRKAVLSARADVALGLRHPDRLVLEFPGRVTFFLFVLLPCAVRAAVMASWRPVLPAILWLAGSWIMELAARLQRSAAGERPWTTALAQGLDWTFEAAKLFNALWRGQWQRTFLKFLYVPEQLLAERERRIAEAWAAVGAVLAMIFAWPMIEAIWK